MGTVVTVMNMKGGVGKTTVAMHLAGVLALYEIAGKKRKVLLIDYDPQFNASQALIPPKTYFELEKQRKTVMAVLLDEDTDLDPYKLQVPGTEEPPKLEQVVHRVYDRPESCLDIVPSTLDLMHVAVGQTDKKTTPIEERFRKFLVECRSKYDVVLIDCHPAGSVFTKTSLRNSDHVIIPVAPQSYAVRGVGLMMKFIEAKKQGTVGPLPHILFNMTDRRGPSAEENGIRSDPHFAGICMKTSLHRYKAFSVPTEGRGFVWHSKKPWSGQAFMNIYRMANEFMNRIEPGVTP